VTVSYQFYLRIAENVDRGIRTAPKSAGGELSEAFIKYLELVYSPEEAEVVQYLRMHDPRTIEEVVEESGLDPDRVRGIIQSMAAKGTIRTMCIPEIPVLLNLHMRYPELKEHDLEAAELYQQFFIREKFYRNYGTSGKGTPTFRSIPIKQAIHPEEKTYTAEEAHDFVMRLETDDLALAPCPCRTRTEKLGIRECKDRFPVASCIHIGPAAAFTIERGAGKSVTKEEAIAYIDDVVGKGLIPTTNNSMDGPFGLCMCCGCCCSHVRGRTLWDNPTAVRPSNYIPVAGDDCILCGTCVDRCLLDALRLDEEAGKAAVDPGKCVGCGVCAVACPEDTLKLHRFERSEPTFRTVGDLAKAVAKDNDRL